MAEGVLDQLLDVSDEGVVAPAESRQRPRALGDRDRATRAGAEGDVVRQLGQADVARRRVAVASSTA